LAAAADYRAVVNAIQQIGAGSDAAHFFTRTEDAYRPTYELVQQGRMPEAETLLAKLLNRMFGPEEEGELRSPFIDGSKLPPFESVRHYFGPAGVFVHSEDDGWSVGGVLLKQAE
jgi:hypothetical protein